MPKFTYTGGPSEPEQIDTLGFSFKKGEPVTVPDDSPQLERLRGNPFFEEEGKKKSAKPAPDAPKSEEALEAEARAAAYTRGMKGDDGPKVPGEPGYSSRG